jgi:acyl dehydratase
MIDRSHVGLQLPVVHWPVEKGRLLAFARAIGETRPEYTDEAAAIAAGHPSLLAPPTLYFGAELDAGTIQALMDTLGVPIDRVLHGEQGFTYERPVHAGDVLTLRSSIADISEKKGGRMEFVTKVTKVTNQRGEAVGEMRSVIVVMNG